MSARHGTLQRQKKPPTQSRAKPGSGRPDLEPHAEDVSAHLLWGEVETMFLKRLAHRLGLAERTLQKMEEGTYGICDVPGRPIPRARLEAVPEAIHTVEAQEQLEGR